MIQSTNYRPRPRERADYLRSTGCYFVSQYEKDNAAWHSSERFRKACFWLAALSGLGALLLWVFWPEVTG